ncbi:Bud-site selection protein [Sistotremastrum niveocremeum HHB9708]|uniref:Bud-site selection protein n=2 Tax=Sistotremastraceae TaxID=3402574 RepID=A0A164RCE1_9AGAM|nr:Bud-site selection protein [Sistotremastrum niveocremeum HHB9708]KZT35138.1 Bud-site selection protein [Sistotremastrum suecicum HHB10207 ss-3]
MDDTADGHVDTSKRGTKRKRGAQKEQKVQDVAEKFAKKLHHAIKEVHKATKLAKVHEAQRIVKRLKNQTKPNEKNKPSKPDEDPESELSALKSIDVDKIAKMALSSRVRKDGVLGKDERVQEVLARLDLHQVDEPVYDVPTAKIVARLRSSKLLAEELKRTIEGLRSVLEGKSKERQNNEDADDGEDQDDSEDWTGIVIAEDVQEGDAEGMLSDDEGDELGAEDDASVAGWESGSIDDEAPGDDIDAAEALDAGWESGSVDSDDVEDVEDDTPPSKRTKGTSAPSTKPAKPPQVPPQKSSTQSTFLPSLSTGFIRGSSSDGEAFSGDEDAVAPRKNRRGQRARKAIWEKKYGKNANHVKKQREEAESFRKEREAKQAARGRGGPPGRGRGGGGFSGGTGRKPFTAPSQDSGWSNQAGGSKPTKAPPTKAPKTDEKPMHPSWVAKKRAQERESVQGAIQKSAGQKIKFA